MITHHVVEEMLISYSSGKLDNTNSLLIATHSALCLKCRKKIEAYEEIGGQILLDQQNIEVSPQSLENVLNKLDDDKENLPNKEITLNDCFKKIPSPLRKYLPKANNILYENWKNFFGFKYYKIAISSSGKDMKALMLSMTPNQKIPEHKHSGIEQILVLEGGFSDEKGSYGPGDVSTQNENDRAHIPIADDTGCICLLVYEGNLIFTGLKGWLLNLLKI